MIFLVMFLVILFSVEGVMVPKFDYFEFEGDFEEFKNSKSNLDKTVIGGKILAKGIANLGIFTVNEMPLAAAKKVLNNENATVEQKERALRVMERYRAKDDESS